MSYGRDTTTFLQLRLILAVCASILSSIYHSKQFVPRDVILRLRAMDRDFYFPRSEEQILSKLMNRSLTDTIQTTSTCYFAS
jgi:hypothetical protein